MDENQFVPLDMIALSQSLNYKNMYLLNYCLNKFCPYIAIFIIMAFTIGWSAPLVYFIIPFIMYIDRHSFKAGYAVAYCECNNIDIDHSG